MIIRKQHKRNEHSYSEVNRHLCQVSGRSSDPPAAYQRVMPAANWSLLPLNKILNSSNRLVKLLWIFFSFCMFMGLLGCVSLAINKFASYSTNFRMDYLTLAESPDFPAITLCPSDYLMSHLYATHTDQQNVTDKKKNLNNNFYEYYSNSFASFDSSSANWLHITNQTVYSKPELWGAINWKTNQARNPLIQRLGPPFEVIVNSTIPKSWHQMLILEMVPNLTKQSLCFTFQLNNTKRAEWAYMSIKVLQPIRSTAQSFEVIIHEANHWPFDNYNKYLYNQMLPDQEIFVFVAKSIERRLNTPRNPCYNETLKLLHFQFEYDMQACFIKELANKVNLYLPSNSALKNRHGNKINNNSIEQKEQFNGKQKQKIDTEQHQSELEKNMLSSHPAEELSFNRSLCQNPCVSMKFKELNLVSKQKHHTTKRGAIDKSTNTKESEPVVESKIVLVSTALIPQASEEYINTIPKLFSEIGGLSSLILGINLIIFLEFIEMLLIKYTSSAIKSATNSNFLTEMSVNANDVSKKSLTSKQYLLPETAKRNRNSENNDSQKNRLTPSLSLLWTHEELYRPATCFIEVVRSVAIKSASFPIISDTETASSSTSSLTKSMHGTANVLTSSPYKVFTMEMKKKLKISIDIESRSFREMN